MNTQYLTDEVKKARNGILSAGDYWKKARQLALRNGQHRIADLIDFADHLTYQQAERLKMLGNWIAERDE